MISPTCWRWSRKVVLCRGVTDVHRPLALNQVLVGGRGVLSPPAHSEQGSHAAAVGFSHLGVSRTWQGADRRTLCSSSQQMCAWCLGSCCPAPLRRCLSPKPVLIARRLSGKCYKKIPKRLVAQGQARLQGGCERTWPLRSHAGKYSLVLSLRGKL